MNWYNKNKLQVFASSFSIPIEYVYDSFLIGRFINLRDLEAYDAETIKDHMIQIKKNIIILFIDLMRKQIEKYLTRPDRFIGRYKEFLQKNYQSANAEELEKMFNEMTTRSERARSANPEDVYNVNWGRIAASIKNLQRISDPVKIAQALTEQGGLFNLVHNTGTPVIDKMTNGNELLIALDKCHSTPMPRPLLQSASYEIAKIVAQELRKIYTI